MNFHTYIQSVPKVNEDDVAIRAIKTMITELIKYY